MLAQLEAQEELLAGQIMFTTLANWVEDIVWVNDCEGRLLFINEAWVELTGLSLLQTAEFGWLKVIHPDEIQGLLDARVEQFENGVPFERTYRVLTREGTYVQLSARTVPLKDSHGKIVRWFGMAIVDDGKDD